MLRMQDGQNMNLFIGCCVFYGLDSSISGLFRPFVRPLVGWLVGPSVTLSSKSMKNGLSRILNDLDSAGRGRKRD